MDTPLTITYRGVDGTALLDQMIEHHVERLTAHCDGLIGVEVAVELHQKELRAGSRYRVAVTARTSTDRHRVADYEPGEKDPAVPLQTTIQRAFALALKQFDREEGIDEPPIRS